MYIKVFIILYVVKKLMSGLLVYPEIFDASFNTGL